MQTLGVVLAGGESRRFGSDKSAAMLGGETLLARAIRRAAAQVDRVIVSGGASPMPDVPAIIDEAPGQGPLAGVLPGLAWASEHGFEHVATFPCDVPFFPPDILQHLSGALTDADYAIVRHGTRKHPVFALWRPACRKRLESAFVDGLRSLHAVDRVLNCAVVQFEDDPDAPDPFFNINSREDFEAAERLLERFDKRPSGI